MTTLTQGGQTTLHTFRMNVAILRFIIKFFLTIFLITTITTFYTKTNKQTLNNTHNYYQAKLISLYQKDPYYKITIKDNKTGNQIKRTITDLLTSRSVISSKNKTTKDIKSSIKLSLTISITLTILLILYFYTKGNKLNKSKHIRGGNTIKPNKLRKIVTRYNKRTLFLPKLIYKIRRLLATLNLIDKSKPYNQPQKQYTPYNIINKIPYPAHTETQHTLITGGSGTGKTQLLKHLLTQIKQKGDRAIVYDKMGSFIPYFYEPNKGDTILNPFDKRSPTWSIFNEIEEPLQLDSIASALMPITKNISDPFWTQAARTIFTSVTQKMKQKGETSNKNLVDNLLKIDLSDIAKIIKGTPAQAIIDERSPKTALSVMSVLSTYLSSLKYLKDTNDINTNGEIQTPFSIRQWIKGESAQEDYNNNNNYHHPNTTQTNKNQSPFLFVSSRADQHESLKPLISTWLEIAINSLLSLKQDPYQNRKIWIILDELPSLHQLPSLNSGIAESRQFGGCFVLSLQLMAQLRSIYGKDEAETISGLTKTKIIFSSPDEETARYSSNSLGKKEQQEIKKNISYGANDIRDGVSLNTQTTTQNLIMPTEIMNLNNLECYLKLPFNFPITKTKIKLHKSKEIAQRFIRDYQTEIISDNMNNNDTYTNITTSNNTTNTQTPNHSTTKDNTKTTENDVSSSSVVKQTKAQTQIIPPPPQRKPIGDENPRQYLRDMDDEIYQNNQTNDYNYEDKTNLNQENINIIKATTINSINKPNQEEQTKVKDDENNKQHPNPLSFLDENK